MNKTFEQTRAQQQNQEQPVNNGAYKAPSPLDALDNMSIRCVINRYKSEHKEVYVLSQETLAITPVLIDAKIKSNSELLSKFPDVFRSRDGVERGILFNLSHDKVSYNLSVPKFIQLLSANPPASMFNIQDLLQ